MVHAGKDFIMSAWEEIDEATQEALIEWLNILDPDEEDKERLAELHEEGRFHFWNCPNCDDLIMEGEPKNWGYFQGARQSEHYGQLCADCGSQYLRLKELAEE